MHLASVSGGTDILSCFVSGDPTLPVYSGEIQSKALGMDVKVYDENGQSILEKKKIIITTREEEALGIATGMTLAGSKSLVFMQNAGFANSISTITSLIQLYEIPLIFLIGWRGYLPDDAPEHLKIGEIQPELLKIIGLKSQIMTEENWKVKCDWALKQIKEKKPCALVIRRMFHD